MNNPAHSIAVLNCSGNANRPELSRTVPSRAEPYRTMQWKSAITLWCQDNCLSLNASKTKELIVDFRKRQQRPYTPLMISGTPVERVSSFKYLGENISENMTWTTHIQTQVNQAKQRLYHLRQLRKFRVLPAVLKTLLRGHRMCIDSVHLSVVWKHLQSGLKSPAELCA